MHLSSKLILSHLAAALLPAGVLLALTWSTAETQFDEEFNERLDSITESLTSDLAQISQRIGAKARALLETEEVERILVDMVRGSLDRRALIGIAGEWMRTGELDLLALMDSDGRVLSSGHLPARFGSIEQALSALSAERPLTPAIVPVQISRDGQIQEQLAIAVGATRKFQAAEVRIAGGRLLDQAFVDHLESLSGAAVAIVGPGDLLIAQGMRARALAQAAEGKPGQSGFTPRKIPLGPSGERGEGVFVLAQFSRARLEETGRAILIGSIGAALSGVVIAFLLGVWISRRI